MMKRHRSIQDSPHRLVRLDQNLDHCQMTPNSSFPSYFLRNFLQKIYNRHQLVTHSCQEQARFDFFDLEFRFRIISSPSSSYRLSTLNLFRFRQAVFSINLSTLNHVECLTLMLFVTQNIPFSFSVLIHFSQIMQRRSQTLLSKSCCNLVCCSFYIIIINQCKID